MRLSTVIQKTSFYCGMCGRELTEVEESCAHPAPIEFGRETHKLGMIYPETIEIVFEDGSTKLYGLLAFNSPSIIFG